ncbi:MULTISPECIES: PTS sugar transporter subunit IIC [unclassified Breznakia]|uniref:PTS mannose/fructose/sorbose/N-acetylgalactosamine transporter subunit IIC n=1 Tax=unclassified Breznakia TaxID=2623764 RepID=UPI002474C94B|nr:MULTISPECIES: PTS sugar transporter subunit IIC [unclassified Breznakia]MDH6366495.1 PTS system N-acetylgalactosamine-specific IIC component [Breznakia sp. PH1-1]MDH6403588.1 PTS system N-acetylgalactosamine-specific IIC component [Breznakia sp. PF1-11]MDH6411297.1 PTS system N-acetylgalactosamine-specific IIC component [Breznakia sp. PFB1-11]MDH6413727.1 PTS system N-acetylgalactosamine-specific IIC component [Breznakia sp. PFB1-14]MDH6415842.1 PTS system N-acetylgalactosamine-specific IIC
MEIIQIVLLAVVTFIFAIDQFSLTELIYRPIIACPIIGLVLGDLNTGLIVGGTYELMMVGNMPVGGAQPPNAVLGGVVAMVFTVKANMDIDTALGTSVIFAVFGQYAVTLTFTIMSGLMSKADKAAEDANPKGITAVNLTSMCILGSLFAAMAVVAYIGGSAMQKPLADFSENFSWIMGGLGAAGGMMRYVGFATLLKIMLSNDLWGIYFAGFAAAAVLGNVEATAGATLLLVAFIGLAIALYDFNTSIRMKENAGSGNGGMTDGI